MRADVSNVFESEEKVVMLKKDAGSEILPNLGDCVERNW